MARYTTSRKLTAAQVQSLNSAPIIIVPAPKANQVIVVDKVIFAYKYGTAAFGGIAAGEDLMIEYTGGNDILATAGVETTGFLDQTANRTKIANVAAEVSAVAGEGVRVTLLSGDITGGTGSTLQVTISYDIVKIF